MSIDKRPQIVEKRIRIGDWEGDNIIGKGKKSALLTLVDRKTLYTIIVRLSGKQEDLLAAAAVIAMKPYRSKIKTITFDNGLEFAKHETIAGGLSAKIYFAHPSMPHGSVALMKIPMV